MLEPGLRSGDSCHPYENQQLGFSNLNNETNDLQTQSPIYMFSPRIPPKTTKKTKGQLQHQNFKGPSMFFWFTKKNKIPNSPQKNSPTPQTSRSQVLFDSSCRPRRWSFPRCAEERAAVFRWPGSGVPSRLRLEGNQPAVCDSRKPSRGKWHFRPHSKTIFSTNRILGEIPGFLFSRWWFFANPLWKICSSKWMISSQKKFGSEKTKYLKPPPGYCC